MTLSFILSDFIGLSSRSFQGFTDIQEIQCLGDSLPPESDVVLMLLYEKANGKILAAMNMRKHECSTQEEYTSCDMVDSDPSKSRLRALITDLAEGQSRVYGCNISVLISGIRMESFSWTITLRHISKWVCRYSQCVLRSVGECCSSMLHLALFCSSSHQPSSVTSQQQRISVACPCSLWCPVFVFIF